MNLSRQLGLLAVGFFVSLALGQHLPDIGEIMIQSHDYQQNRRLQGGCPLRFNSVTRMFDCASDADLGGMQWKCVTTGSIGAGVAAVVTVTWDTPFSRCANTGPNPLAPCTVDGDCGSSAPCTPDDYRILGSVADIAGADLAALRLNHISTSGTSSASAVVFNADATNPRTGLLCLAGRRTS